MLDQLGGEKGCSTSHYLAMLIQFILEEIDSDQTQKAVILMAIDMSKAFNRINHHILVTILHDIGVPMCALRLVISYLHGG